MNGNEDPKTELVNMRAILAARLTEEAEQARRFRSLARDRDQRVTRLTAALVEIDAAVSTIDQRRA